MAFRYLIPLCAVLACANAGLLASHVAIANPSVDAVASTQQDVVRSFAGTVSSYSKAVDTPYSSVRKSDTRIQNNVYTPAIAKTTYAAPLYTQATPIVAKTLVHAPAPVVEKAVYAAPAPVLAKTVYSAPAPVLAKTVYSAPAPVYAAPAPVYHAPAPVYHAPAPVVAKTVYSAPAPVVAKTIYSAPAPVVAKTVYSAPAPVYHAPAPVYAAPAPTVQYSPAESVSHMSFDGFGTHWGF
ncbi:cuticle protein 16.5 isoform X2 [Drosophila ficusphila]|uniref:cuticle protein 16.5 isoform X2 n=1 Tax=Drosophila ficusphila TaxID=30025 RepID=UPI001C894826|nr:cuticle protein 16.5 isoform X2 [Drosophila ficusphila]